MTNNQSQQYEIGMIGLGVMGRNLVLNMADHGFSVAGYDKDFTKVESLNQEGAGKKVFGAKNIKEFIDALHQPRAVMILVPAGAPVDAVINDLIPLLQPGDLIIDGGNSYFKDSDIRAQKLAEKKIQFLSVGISGGEEGARLGPCLMPSGPKDAYERVRPIFEAVAAKVDGTPCVDWLGLGSTGHYVKMVHNGIEYGIMQLLAESYDLMKRGLGLSDAEIAITFALWDKGDLNGYLTEITSHIMSFVDKKTGKLLINEILGVAQQSGTGLWTTQSGMELQVPIPTIDQAVVMRVFSTFTKERKEADAIYQRAIQNIKTDRSTFLKQLADALYTATMITYAQGMALLVIASNKYKHSLDLEAVSRIWRGGCIIRSGLLNDMCAAFKTNDNLANLLLDPQISQKIKKKQDGLRQVISQAAESGVPIPGMMASLSYLDSYSSAWLPANLIQAQRDYFGAHTYELIDTPGNFHTEWEKERTHETK